MANLIPQWHTGPTLPANAVIAPAQVFTRIQKDATNIADQAQKFKNAGTATIRELNSFYQQLRAKGIYFNSVKNVTLLKDYANSIHPDANYDFTAAIDTCISAYQGFGVWYRAMVDNMAKYDTDDNEDLVEPTPDFAGVGPVINAIISTVEPAS